MSNHLISTTYKRELRTPMRKAVMALLADKASDDGSGIWASKQTLADELCCSKQAIIDTIKGFLAEGLLVEIGTRGVRYGYTVEYGIVVSALEALPIVKCHIEREKRRSEKLTGQRSSPVQQTDRSTSHSRPVKQVDPNPPEPPYPHDASHHSESASEPDPDRLTVQEFEEGWKALAAEVGLPTIRGNLSGKRLKSLKARIREYPPDDFIQAFDRIRSSPFLRGEVGNWSGATPEFFLRPDSINKILEGSYDRPKH